VLGVAILAYIGGALSIAALVAAAGVMPGLSSSPAVSPTVALELEAGYPNGATGAILLRGTLADLHEAGDDFAVRVPPGADRVRLRVADRAGIYAGQTTTVERESEPPPAFIGRGWR
jgi:hypothetical protein